jgi:hypothetical protein
MPSSTPTPTAPMRGTSKKQRGGGLVAAPSLSATIEPVTIEIVGSGSLCAWARRMIAEGADPAVPVVWARGGVPVFVQTHALGWWAEREIDGRTRLLLRKDAGVADLPRPADNPANPAATPAGASCAAARAES